MSKPLETVDYARLAATFRTHALSLKYAELSRQNQLAIATYASEEPGGWGWRVFGSHPLGLPVEALRNYLLQHHAEQEFLCANLPLFGFLNQLVREFPPETGIESADQLYAAFQQPTPGFVSYTQMGLEDYPTHSREKRWPLILLCSGQHLVLDGWHRLADYIRNGDEHIPVVWTPYRV